MTSNAIKKQKAIDRILLAVEEILSNARDCGSDTDEETGEDFGDFKELLVAAKGLSKFSPVKVC